MKVLTKHVAITLISTALMMFLWEKAASSKCEGYVFFGSLLFIFTYLNFLSFTKKNLLKL